MATPIDVYGLSPTQEGMLFHALYAPGEGVYFEQRWCVLEGTLDTELFRAAWQQVVARHDVLRSGFHWREVDRPVQVVYDTATLDWVVDDWQTDGGDDRLRQFLAADRARGFALDAAPLMRCALFQLGPNRHRFVWSYHHLLMDGWCNGVLIAEVLTCYDALRRGAVASLPPTRPYRDFIDWLQQQDPAPAERYWRGTLRGFDAPTPLGIDRIVVDGPGRFHEVQRDVAPATRAALQAFARSARLTLNTVCQGAWALLLARYSGQSDVLFGATLSGRPPTLAGAQRMVGLFISTVPVRVRVDPERSVVDALRSLQAAQRDREQYGHCALTALQRWSDVPVGTPLFDSVLVFENYPVSLDAALGTGDGSLTLADGGGYERTNYPLAIMVLPTDGALRIVVRHDTARIDAAAAERLLRHFETVLLGLTRPDMTFGSVPVPDANECATLEQWGRGVAVAVDPVPVHALFAAQARTRGDAIALVFEPGASAAAAVALSYAELNTRANRLAVHLRAEGVAPGARVGVCMGRSVELVVALLAVLKTGAAYVPLDPDYPAERLAFIVADAGLDRLLVAGLDGIASAGDVPVVDVTADAARIAASSDADPHIDVRSDDLAYLIYTSGSTGRPKGVAICHRSLRNFIDAMAVAPGLDPEDRLLAVTTVSFDIAGLELFLPLARGARLVLASSGVARDPQQLAAALDRHAIRVMQASPATWRLLMDIGWAGRRELKALCGGEALDRGLATWLHGRVAALWNLYGPTETTIWSAALRIEPRHLTGDTVPFGGAIANTRLHVLDDRLQPAPIGVDGELYIGGAGLSAGYWNRPDLTAAAFVPDPFSTDPAARLYRTGDRVRFRDDGLLTFVGRRDHQIKLRGFRIELGEIEAALGRYPNVMQAVAIVRRDDPDNPQLVAYVVSAAGAAPDVDRLREHLRGLLPAPMVPAAIVVLDRMPLTPNGKVDRRALPAPTSATSATVVGAEVAADPLQELVAGIWADVLGRDRVVPQDDFFALGGHSLLATRVVARLADVCGIDVPLRVLFEQPRLAAFVEAIAADTTSRQAATTIPPLPDGAELPLSFAQQRQWLIAQLEPDSNAYSIPVVLRLRGPIDVARIERSFDRIVQRHQTLRTVFRAVDGRPCAEVSPWAPTRMPVIDVRMVGDIDRQAQIDAQVQTLVGLPFDLAQSPLWRLRLLRTADDDHVLVLVLHHIVADDWSIGVLVREWATFYQADTDQPVAAVPPLGVQYADFAAWQRTLDFQPDLDYWRAQLRDLPPALALPTDRGNADETPRGARFEFRLDAAQTASLHHLGRQHGATLFMTLLAGFDVLLSRWCDGTDIAVGTPIANRRRADLEGLIGMFVNTLVLRTDLGGNPPVDALLARVRRMTLGAYEHQDVPFEQVIDALPVVRGTGRSPLFQVLFALQNTPPPMIAIDDLQWSALPFTTAAAKFDLSLSFRETGDGLHGVFEYRADRFEPATIARMAGHYRRLLRQMVAHPQRRIAELAMLGADEMQQLDAWGTGPAQPPVSDTVHGAFAQQVAATPDAVAVVHGDWRCTYRELDRRSNRLAHLLRAADVGRGALVGLWAERSPDAIVAMLAILKAGGAYVPLDPQAPAERTALLLRQTAMRWVVARTAMPLPAVDPMPELIALDAVSDRLMGMPDREPLVAGTPDDLAYVLHTSGSTGRPKGVCTPHRGVLRLVLSPGYVELGADEVVLQAAPLSFDASTFEIWGALLNGGTLAIQGGSRLSLDDLARTLREQRVTTLWLTAGLFNLVVDERIDALSGVRQLLAGGDVLSVHHVRKAQAALPGVRFVNGYGPTETTTFACCHRVDAGESAATIPIGRPIGQTRIHVLDAQMVPVPVGAVGELYVGGAGVARGYLDRPDLTAEVFVPNPFFDPGRDAAEDCALVLYRTGDRVRMRSDGAVEFVGRRDDQVKLRGFRIEPAEIEQVLGMHPAIQDASVIVSGEAGDRRLVAYVVPAAHAAMPPTAEMRRFAADRLPDYMVPATFVTLSALPLSTTGKVDRRALPAPAWDDAADATSAARTALEATLVAIWSSLLPAAAVGVHDNFFDLGGDSILAMQLASRAARAGLSIAPAQVFEHQTIAGLAAAIERQGGAGGRDWMETGERPSGDVPLTPIQRWFFDQALAVPSHFNQAVCVVLPSTIERAHVVASIAAVVSRHDAFRLRFEPAADGWRQHYAEADAVVPVEWFDVPDPDPSAQDAAVERHANALQAGLDLVTGPLMRIGGFDLGPQRGLRLLLVVHHLIIDGVSWRTLLGELQQAYLRCRRGQPVALGPKPRSWRAWAEWLSTSVTASDAALAYWRGVVDAGPQVLPLDGPGGVNTMEHAQSRTRVLDESLTHALLHDVPALRQWQPQELLLAALATTLTDWIGAPDVLLDLEFHGRPSTGPDFTGTIGWFTALFPLRLARAPTDDPQMRVSAVQSQLRDVPDHGCSYGILRGREGGAALAVTPPIAFNYLGRFDGAVPDDGDFSRVPAAGLRQDPRNRRAHLIDINSWIDQGRLTVEWTFGSNHHSPDTIAALAQRFLDELTRLIAFGRRSVPDGHAGFAMAGLDADALQVALAQVSFHGAD